MKLQSKADVGAVLYIVLGGIEQATKESPLKGIPNGHLFAMLMDMFDIDQWQKIIHMIKDQGYVTETNHLLQITDKGSQFYAKLKAIFEEGSIKVAKQKA